MNVPCAGLLIALFCVSPPTHADVACTDSSALNAAVASGYVPDSQALIACKAMPTNPKQTIVAFVREVGSHTYTMTVLVAMEDDGKIMHRFVDEDPSFGPNGDPTGLEVDTARYLLAPSKRAFGVRVTHSLNPWDSTQDLNLFIPTENKLHRVLKDLTVASSSGRACELGSHEMKRTLSVAKSTAHGFYDLFITTKRIEAEPTYGPDQQCSSRETARSDTVRLQYTGESYAYPPGFY